MKKFAVLIVCTLMASAHASVIYNDSTGDIDAGLASGNGTLDILSMEVSHTSSDLIFELTLNGNVSTTDWGKFMIGIANGGSGTTTSDGWSRPIFLDSSSGGMTHWIGSWVDSGGGAQLYTYNSGTTSWDGPSALKAFSFSGGAQSLVTFTLSRAALGLSSDTTFYFDAYASGGGGSDSAIDALANPNISVTAWDQAYTSSSGTGINSYTIPEPATMALLGFGAICGLVYRVRRRA